MASLNYFPARVAFVNPDGTLTSVASRSWNELVNRTGGITGSAGNDTFVSQDFSSIEAGQSAGGDVLADVFGGSSADVSLNESITQPLGSDSLVEMVMQPLQDRAMTAPEPVSATASPFTYRAGRDGFYVVTGGTVTKQEYGRGAVYTDVGLMTSMLPILLGDAIRVTYSAKPLITFIPR